MAQTEAFIVDRDGPDTGVENQWQVSLIRSPIGWKRDKEDKRKEKEQKPTGVVKSLLCHLSPLLLSSIPVAFVHWTHSPVLICRRGTWLCFNSFSNYCSHLCHDITTITELSTKVGPFTPRPSKALIHGVISGLTFIWCKLFITVKEEMLLHPIWMCIQAVVITVTELKSGDVAPASCLWSVQTVWDWVKDESVLCYLIFCRPCQQYKQWLHHTYKYIGI